MAFRFCLTFCVVLACLNSVQGVQPSMEEDASKLDSIFTVNFNNDLAGGCKRWKDEIETSYKEALDMLHNAYEAASHFDSDPPDKADKEKYQTWLAHTQLYQAMFGDNSSKSKLGTKVHAEVLNRYLQIYRGHLTGSKSPITYLFCNDEFLVYKPSNFPDPRSHGSGSHTIGKPAANMQAFPDGAYFAANLPRDYSLFWTASSEKGQRHPVCDPVTTKLAESITVGSNNGRKVKALILCPALLSQFAKPWSLMTIPTPVHEGDSMDSLDNFMAMTWFREMAHYVLDFENHLVDKHGKIVQQEATNRKDTLGWKNSALLAKKNPELAAKNPDNYAFFAMGAFLDHFYWASGVAKKTPKKGLLGGLKEKLKLAHKKPEGALGGSSSGGFPGGASPRLSDSSSEGGSSRRHARHLEAPRDEVER